MNRHTFLSEWFSDCEGKIELRALPPEQAHDVQFFKLDDFVGMKNFCQKKGDKNLYFGLATRDGKGGTKADIVNIPGVWADIDFPSAKREGMPKHKADKLLKECPLQPTFIIDSGNGYQPYWKFKEPTDNIQIVELINRQIAQYFESDPVHDATRILRLPETFNHNYEPKRIVKVLRSYESNQYNESDFEEHFPPLKSDSVTADGRVINPPGWQDEALQGVVSGGRHYTASKLIGRYIEKGLSDKEILPIMQQWDKKNTPSSIETDYGKGELPKIITGIRNADNRNHPPEQDPLIFPSGIMTGVAGDFAKLYSSYLEPPPQFFYMAFLTCLGSVLARSVTFNSELDTQIRLYMLILGESADDRKSTALIKTMGFFRDSVDDFRSYLAVNSAEGLQKLFEKSKTILLCFDEFKQFMDKCNILTSVLLTCVNSLFEQNYTSAHTKTASIDIDDAYLSLVAASTLETYERVWGPNSLAIGFNNRIWIVPGTAKRKKAIPDAMPLEAKTKLKVDLASILAFVGGDLELSITPEAGEIFQAWYENLEQSMHSKRLEGYALRFMGLLAVNELKAVIDTETVNKALKLCNWQLEVRKLLDPIDADNKIALLEEKIRRQLSQKALTERELKRNLDRTIKKMGIWCFTTALKNLRDGKEIYYKKAEKTIFIHLNR